MPQASGHPKHKNKIIGTNKSQHFFVARAYIHNETVTIPTNAFILEGIKMNVAAMEKQLVVRTV